VNIFSPAVGWNASSVSARPVAAFQARSVQLAEAHWLAVVKPDVDVATDGSLTYPDQAVGVVEVRGQPDGSR
jgi:hypothetical protein